MDRLLRARRRLEACVCERGAQRSANARRVLAAVTPALDSPTSALNLLRTACSIVVRVFFDQVGTSEAAGQLWSLGTWPKRETYRCFGRQPSSKQKTWACSAGASRT